MGSEVIKDTDELNSRIYHSALHLFEAGKYMSDVDANLSKRWMNTALKLIEVIPEETLPKDHLTQDEMDSIMDEIFGSEI